MLSKEVQLPTRDPVQVQHDRPTTAPGSDCLHLLWLIHTTSVTPQAMARPRLIPGVNPNNIERRWRLATRDPFLERVTSFWAKLVYSSTDTVTQYKPRI